MVGKRRLVSLVSPEEAIRLHEQSTLDEYYAVRAIHDTYWKGKTPSNDDDGFEYFTMLVISFVAGRVQGIREERKRRTKKM